MKHILIIFILLLSGCSTIEVSHDYSQSANFTKLKSFQWLPKKLQTQPKAADFEQKMPFIAQRIKHAIEEQMLKKGLVVKDSNADAYITFQMIETKKTLKQSKTRIGLGLGSVFNYGFGSIGFDLSPERETFQQSLLSIDIQDKKKQLLWRGKSTSPVKKHPSPEETTALINEIIEKLLTQYPPK